MSSPAAIEAWIAELDREQSSRQSMNLRAAVRARRVAVEEWLASVPPGVDETAMTFPVKPPSGTEIDVPVVVARYLMAELAEEDGGAVCRESPQRVAPPITEQQFPGGPTAAFWNGLFPYLGGTDPWTPQAT